MGVIILFQPRYWGIVRTRAYNLISSTYYEVDTGSTANCLHFIFRNFNRFRFRLNKYKYGDVL